MCDSISRGFVERLLALNLLDKAGIHCFGQRVLHAFEPKDVASVDLRDVLWLSVLLRPLDRATRSGDVFEHSVDSGLLCHLEGYRYLGVGFCGCFTRPKIINK